MMPGISHEMHVYVWRWWDRHHTYVDFHHTVEGMRRLNDLLPDMRWRVTPAVFHMFRLHMWMRHNVTIEKVQECLHGLRNLSLCCVVVGGHRRRFYL